jgi:hypothetical protein
LQNDKADEIGLLHSLQFPSKALFGDVLLVYDAEQDLEQKLLGFLSISEFFLLKTVLQFKHSTLV